MGIVIGIDLGTANSCVAYLKDGRPEVLADKNGNRTTPSIFALSPTKEPLVGYAAAKQAETNRQNTIFAVKRLIGRKYKSKEVAEAAEKLPYKIVPASNGDAWVEVDGEKMSPEQVSANVLTCLKQVAEEALGEKIFQAVITVPAHFNDSQRQATRDAGMLAGLDVLRLVNEPTAAALAYGIDVIDTDEAKANSSRNIAVFDLGGGTFDISILRLQEGVFDVLATNGDTFLGGEDFDLALMNHLINEFERTAGGSIRTNKDVLERLKQAAKDAKHKLSDVTSVEVTLPFVQGLDHLQITLTRKALEQIVAPIVSRMDKPCHQALADAKLSPRDIHDVILVGGMTRMPAVKRRCEKIFGIKPLDTVDPDEAVAAGAAIQAGLLQGAVKGVSLFDVTSLSLGIEVQGGRVHRLIPRNTKVPSKKTEIFTTSAPNQPQVTIHIVQGESDFSPDNKSLGVFELEGIRPAPRGVPDIAVTFEIDAQGIVNVSAQDSTTGQEQSMRIVASSGLSDQEIDDLLREQRIKQLQEQRRKSRDSGEEYEHFIDGELDSIRGELRTLVFVTQAHLQTDAKGFRGHGRKNLEEILIQARTALEESASDAKIEEILSSLKEKRRPLDKYLEELLT